MAASSIWNNRRSKETSLLFISPVGINSTSYCKKTFKIERRSVGGIVVRIADGEFKECGYCVEIPPTVIIDIANLNF